MPVNLLDLNKEEFKKFLDSFDHVFSDCDGVIWTNNKPFPGSPEFYENIKKLGKSLNFVSNNSMRSEAEYNKLFESCGIPNGFDILTIPSTAIAEYLKCLDFKKTAYCVTCQKTIDVLEKNGIKCAYGPDQAVDLYDGDFSRFVEDDPDVGAVIFDSDFKINIPKLNKAITYLKRPEVILIDGPSDRLVPLKPGVMTLSTAPFTEIVCQETNRKPIQIGKPGKIFGEAAMRRCNVTDASRVLFIGDMIEQDVALGKAMGFKTLLVLTNLKKEDMDSNTKIVPDYYSNCLGELVPMLRSFL